MFKELLLHQNISEIREKFGETKLWIGVQEERESISNINKPTALPATPTRTL